MSYSNITRMANANFRTCFITFQVYLCNTKWQRYGVMMNMMILASTAGILCGIGASCAAEKYIQHRTLNKRASQKARDLVGAEKKMPSQGAVVTWIQYLMLILAGGVWSCLVVQVYGLSLAWLALLGIGWLLLTLTAIDARTFLLPDVFTLTGAPLAFLTSIFILHMDAHDVFLGAVVASGGLYLAQKIYFLVTRQIGAGLGDVKLLIMLGALVGFQALPSMIFISFSLASVWYLVSFLGRKGMRTAYIPLGPFLVAGTFLQLILGDAVQRFVS